MKSVALRLFSAFNLQIDGEEINHLLPIKAQGLLSYLMMNKDTPCQRDFLTKLLWPESNQKSAQTSLRQLVWKLKQALPESTLLIDHKTIQFNLHQTHSLDVSNFNQLILPAKKQITPSSAERLEAAWTLYQGRFLANFEIKSSDLFERWQFATAESLLRDVIWVGEQLVNYYHDTNQVDKEISCLRRLLELDSWNEQFYQQLMQVLAKSQRRSEALNVYSQLKKTLAVELEIEPEPATKALYDQIRHPPAGDGMSVAKPASKPKIKRHILSLPLQPLIGRIELQVLLRVQILSPATRLVTLVGPGGIGKTHLSQAVASNVQSGFKHGAVFVALSGVGVPESEVDNLGAWYQQMVLTIIKVLKITTVSLDESEQALFGYLHDKELLLVLDNFETVFMAQSLIVKLLEAAPKLTIVVTSRERLALPTGEVIAVRGLQTPTDATEDLTQMESVQLFIHEAQRTNSFFQLNETNRTDIAELCNLVGGWPLALKMVASWTPHLDTAEIVQELKDGHALLTDVNRNMPERHQSMHYILSSGWQLLSVPEQWLLAKLSVFKGTFSQRAARGVCQISLPVLHKFWRISWLQPMGTGFYAFHALQRQFLAEKWQVLSSTIANQDVELEQTYASFYLNLVHDAKVDMRGAHSLTAVKKLAFEIDEVVRAWHWGIKHQQWHIVTQALPGLDAFIVRSGLFQMWLSSFEQTHKKLPAIPDVRVLQVGLLLSIAQIYRHTWQWQEGITAATEAKELLDETIHPSIYFAVCLQILGDNLANTGQHSDARAYLNEARLVYRQIDDPYGEAQVLFLLGFVLYHLFNYDEAQEAFSEAYRMQQSIKDTHGAMLSLYQSGLAYFYQGKFRKAEQNFLDVRTITQDSEFFLLYSRVLYGLGLVYQGTKEYKKAFHSMEQALHGFKSLGVAIREILCWWNLSAFAVDSGAFEDAKSYLQHGLERVYAAGHKIGEGILLGELGRLALAEGKVDKALDYLLSSLTCAIQQGDWVGLPDRLLEIARCYLKLGQVDTGITLLQYSLHYGAPGIGLLRGQLVVAQLSDEEREVMKRPLSKSQLEQSALDISEQTLQNHTFRNMSLL